MKVFNLPDLGEGLPDAEIVEWLVAEGDTVQLDQPLVSMETAKAVVEVPSPFAGKVARFHGQAGDVIKTGAPLAEFKVDGDEDNAAGDDAGDKQQAADEADQPPATKVAHEERDLSDYSERPGQKAAETEVEKSDSRKEEPVAHPARPRASEAPTAPAQDQPDAGQAEERADTGTVVGNVQSSNEVLSERTSNVGGVKVTPAVRALARKLKVDIAQIKPSGTDGVVTAGDVRQAAANGSATAAPRQPVERREQRRDSDTPQRPAEPANATREEPKTEQRPPATGNQVGDDWEPVRGTRRTMARVMTESHKSVVPTTLMDDADIHAWRAGEDITARLLRALWSGAQAEPGLNAWFDGDNSMRIIHKNMHVGMAVDTPDGLFVAALRNVNKADRGQIRNEINRLRDNVSNRSIPPEDLKDYTIVLSNFGKFAGRYATPVITPPCVAIVAAGALRHEVVPVLGGVEVHRTIPLSLTFDHRACTGGEAARFLKAMLDDLASAE